MTLGFCSFSSGSSGNSYLVCSRENAIIIDAGISAKKIVNGLQECKIEKEMVKALLITHEHIDHVKSIRAVTKKFEDMGVYASKGTFRKLEKETYQDRCNVFVVGDKFHIGDIEVTSFKISHDAAEPCGYSFRKDEEKISIVTDTGCMTEEIHHAIKDSGILVLEANHDPEILKMGDYPWSLKQRILGDRGHLSNDCAGKAILHFLRNSERKVPMFFLAHLSRKNNFPEIAFETVKAVVEEGDYYLDKDFVLRMLLKDDFSGLHWL